MQITGVPPWLFAGESSSMEAVYGPNEPSCIELAVHCVFWIYCILPDDNPADDPVDGLIYAASNPEQVPEEARPVIGTLVCPSAKQKQISLKGHSMGPFSLSIDESINAHESASCLLAELKFQIESPDGFQYCVQRPNRLAERCEELGGCELQRMTECPVAVGSFKMLPPPNPLCLQLTTSCCNRPHIGAQVAIDWRAPMLLDDAGCLKIPRRRRKDRSGVMQLQIKDVPSYLLPDESCEVLSYYGPSQPETLQLEVSCLIWVYWLPPEEEEEEDDDPDMLGDEPEPAEGLLYIAVDPDQIPEEALPVSGFLGCPGARKARIELNGQSMGPFHIKGSFSSDSENVELCLLSAIEFVINSPEGFQFYARDPSPLRERCAELGGCEIERLLSCPAAVGNFQPLPVPPLHLSLTTHCCHRGFSGASISIAGQPAVPLEESGLLQLRRKRKGGQLQLRLDGVPQHLLPRGSCSCVAHYGPADPECIDLHVSCLVWIYWIPPDDEEYADADAEEDEEMEPPSGLIFVAADEEQIPEEAKPVEGILECPGARRSEIKVDGSSTGPYPLSLPSGASSYDSTCLVASLRFCMTPPQGFEFLPRDPSPLAERCLELGGCELQRLISCPAVVGSFKALSCKR